MLARFQPANNTMQHIPPPPDTIAADVARALAEDLGAGDISATLIPPTTPATAHIITRDAGIWCGSPWVTETAAQVAATIRISWHVADGQTVTPEQTIATLQGPAAALLSAERTMLNFAGLLSGTATTTARYKALISHTKATLLDTRKTVPGLRAAQKYAVRAGGGTNHRMGLYDAYLLKENHIAAAGGLREAVALAKQQPGSHRVEVEVETLEELNEAIAAGADTVMVDNFTTAQTREAVTIAAGRIKLEASGGISESTITEAAETGVDYISIGNLTKHVHPLDLSMRFV